MPRPGHGNEHSVKRPKNTKKTLDRLLSYIKKYRIQMIIVLFTIVISSLANIIGTYMLKPILNDYIVPFIGEQDADLTGFIRMLLILGAVYLSGAISTFIYTRLMVNISSGTLRDIRVDLFNHMEELPIKFFDAHPHGEVMSLYTNDVDALREMMGHGIPHLFLAITNIIGIFTVMLILSPFLTGIVLLILLVMIFTMKFIGKRSSLYFRKQQKSLGNVNGYIEEMIEGQKVIKVFIHEEAVKRDFAKINNELFNSSSNAHSYANILMPILGNLSYVLFAIISVVGAILTIIGYIDIGTMASFLQYTRSFSQPLTQVSMQLNSILTALAGAERIFALLDEPVEIDDGYVTLVNANIDDNNQITESDTYTGRWAWKHPHHDGTLSYKELKGDIQFENVIFSYVPEKVVLNNISLYAKPGQKIAFVGSTGAGKTTITNLINRFYELQSGKIRYDGINIQKIKKDDLRRSLGMVLQDTQLFTNTVRENIRYGNLSATDEEVEQAAKLANAHPFIKHLPDGYDTMITNSGANLSQGQRQLLAIARAEVANPPVLILDEATSSIDTRTEALIEKGMDQLMANRTVFVIAHRLSTVRNAKAILVLENGEIIERGDHESLIELRGRYYQLYTGTSELE